MIEDLETDRRVAELEELFLTPTRSAAPRTARSVFAAYASARGRTQVDRELYLPRSWTGDPDRCRGARIPKDGRLATKGELARCLVLGALAPALPIAWVTAHSTYGQELRSGGSSR